MRPRPANSGVSRRKSPLPVQTTVLRAAVNAVGGSSPNTGTAGDAAANAVILHTRQSHSHSQEGQTLVLGMIIAGAVALAMARYFETGLVLAGKVRQDHALDAAAYSGALVQARALNMLSYINRAQVAHQVAMAHLVTLGSLARFASTEASRAGMGNPPAYVIGMHFGADHGAAYLAALKAVGLDHLSEESGALATSYARHDQLSRAVLASVSSHVVSTLSAARKQAMREVLSASFPGEEEFELAFSDDALEGFLSAYSGNSRLRPFLAQVSARYGFLDPRDDTARSRFPVSARCPSWRHELRRRGVTTLDTGGRWQAIDTQSYHAVRSNRWIGCYFREYAMGWGWIPPRQAHLIDAPYVQDAPEDFSNQDFWRWVNEATQWSITGGNANPLANSWAYNARRQWPGGGIPAFHDLSHRDPGVAAHFSVSLKRTLRPGLQLHSTSAAETFFRRPELRQDGQRELPSTFHPYWQSRLRNRPLPRKTIGACSRVKLSAGNDGQAGQALLETLVASLALASLWVAVHWLSHYQDVALSATHASAYTAFAASRLFSGDGESAASQPGVLSHFAPDVHRWKDLQGRPSFVLDRHFHVDWKRGESLTAYAQPGQFLSDSSLIRRDFQIDDEGLVTANVALNFHDSLVPESSHSAHTSLLGLRAFDAAYPSLRRHISILVDAGHARTDADAQARVDYAPLAWARAYESSRAAGRMVHARAQGIDDAWGRTDPSFDWLGAWQGDVPSHLLSAYSGG